MSNIFFYLSAKSAKSASKIAKSKIQAFPRANFLKFRNITRLVGRCQISFGAAKYLSSGECSECEIAGLYEPLETSELTALF